MSRLLGMDLLGQRVRIFFDGAKFYEGQIDEYEERSGKHHILFDDKDKGWYNIAEEEDEGSLEWPAGTWPTGEPARRRRTPAKPEPAAPTPQQQLQQPKPPPRRGKHSRNLQDYVD